MKAISVDKSSVSTCIDGKRLRLAIQIMCGLAAAVACDVSSAQTQRGGAVEEVIVTAQKRSERLQDVPVSIAVVSGDSLDKSPVVGVTDVLNRIPGVSTEVAAQGGTTFISVRGVSAAGPLFAGPSPIAYYLDSVPFALVKSAVVPDMNTYDLDHVEVLRGPQGTLYGASALNGVVRVLTKDADLDSFEIKARTSVSSMTDGGENYRADMAVNAPLIDDKLAARLIVGYQNLGGWLDTLDRKDINTGELRNVRIKLKAQPTDALSLGLSAWTSRSDFDAPSAGPESRKLAITPQKEPISTDFDNVGLTVTYELPSVTITSATGYMDYKNDGYLDLTRVGVAPGNMLRTLLESNTLSEELVVNSAHEGVWRWTLGAFYRDAEDRRYQASAALFAAPVDQNNFSRSAALFGELTRSFFDRRFDVTAGLRYFEDDVKLREHSRFTEVGGIPAGGLTNTDRTFDKVTKRMVFTWHVAEDVTAYASYSEGFRSGSDPDPSVLNVDPDFRPTEPDTLRNYELGTKFLFAGGRIGIEAVAYYVDWTDLQESVSVIFDIDGGGGKIGLPALINVGSASGPGIDFEINSRPIDGLNLGLSVGYNDVTRDQDLFSGGLVTFRKGEHLATSPKTTFATSADYSIPIGSGGYEARISAAANYRSRTQNKELVGGRYQVIPNVSLWNANASFSIQSPDHWTATLFADNITDEVAGPARSGPGGLGPNFEARLRPRTIGAQLDFSFK